MTRLLLTQSFDGFLGRKIADILLKPGQLLHVQGECADGVETFLQYLSGNKQSRATTKIMDGIDVSSFAPEDLHRLGLVFVSGHRKTFPSLTIEDHLVLRLRGLGRSVPSQKEMVAECISLFPFLDRLLNVPTGNLSGGQQQMAMLASAMVGTPIVLIIDEPLLGLSAEAKRYALRGIQTLAAVGTSLIIVEQQRSIEFDWANFSLQFTVSELMLQSEGAIEAESF
ncbi:MAG TPA: ATP-binding cassette domain-containing protein [Planctomycetaceae bacterium]|nr:ATP-binding cassette domain-containing protein [Planctomycetaceae bacterium]HQZ66974.1 ATP-binding cassette domain-containing protein [Planctomycetaceae bacterium]